MSEKISWCGWNIPVLPGFSYVTEYSDVMDCHVIWAVTEDESIMFSSEYPFKEYRRESYGSWQYFDCTKNSVRLDGLYREQQDNYTIKPFVLFQLTECEEEEPEQHHFTDQLCVKRKLTVEEKSALLTLLYGISREKENGGDGLV